MTTGGILNKANGHLELEARLYSARSRNPDYHYVPELASWYDSDEECEARNCADNIMRRIEDNWNY